MEKVDETLDERLDERLDETTALLARVRGRKKLGLVHRAVTHQ
jgi:hypothetical protein